MLCGVKIWNFQSLFCVVTLKIRSWSPKSNQIFKPSQRYNTWSLARICHLVQEIVCRQAFLVKIWNFQSASVTLKMRSMSPKSNHFFPPPNNAYVPWSKSTHFFRRWSADKKLRGCQRSNMHLTGNWRWWKLLTHCIAWDALYRDLILKYM